MKQNDKMKQKKKQIVEVEWYDACSQEIDDDFLNQINPDSDGMEFLVVNTTVGYLHKRLEKITIIITEKSTSSKQEVTIIPNAWIKKVTKVR